MANRQMQDQQSKARQNAGVPIPDDEDLLEAQDRGQSAAPEPAEIEDENAEDDVDVDDDDDAEDDVDAETDDEEEDGSGGHV